MSIDVEIGGDVLYETETFTKEDYGTGSGRESAPVIRDSLAAHRANQNGLFNAYSQEAMTGMDHTVHNGDEGATGTENGYEYTNWQNAVTQSGYNVRCIG